MAGRIDEDRGGCIALPHRDMDYPAAAAIHFRVTLSLYLPCVSRDRSVGTDRVGMRHD